MWTLNLGTINQLRCVRDALALALQADPNSPLNQGMFDKVDAWVQAHDARVKSAPLQVMRPE